MRLPELTPKRRELLANFFLNVAVVCLAAAILENNWRGILPCFGGVILFFLFTKEN